MVVVSGAVMQESMFWSIKDRVSDIIQRAGGLTLG
jgi:protein involved in polysaccharide export with SLBB domain